MRDEEAKRQPPHCRSLDNDQSAESSNILARPKNRLGKVEEAKHMSRAQARVGDLAIHDRDKFAEKRKNFIEKYKNDREADFAFQEPAKRSKVPP